MCFASSSAGLARERRCAWADAFGLVLGLQAGLHLGSEWPPGVMDVGLPLVFTAFSMLVFVAILWRYPFSWQRSEVSVGEGEMTLVEGARRQVVRFSEVERVSIARSSDGRHSHIRIRDIEGETYLLQDPEKLDVFGRWAGAALGMKVRERRLWPLEYRPVLRGVATALVAGLAAMAPLLWL